MSASARTAQIVSLISVLTFCHDASIDAHRSAFSAAIETHADEMADIQVMPETNSERKSERNFSLQLATLSPGQSEQSEERLSANAEPFGLPTMTALPSDVSAKWIELQSRLLIEEQTLAACQNGENGCSADARRFLSIVKLGRHQNGRALFGQINRAINLAIRPMNDWAQYGVADYWATPLETLNKGAGDCEDYAIAKYVALREAGITPDNLRLVIVRSTKGQTSHAILAVRYEKNWLVLDNRTLVMVDTDMAQYYYPLFVLDQRGVRTFITAVASR